ncbi:SAM-dependent methyltransferase [Frankia sp. AiPs1]|uniref:SAM-dependent methyltransferase n=1 Tax=Frankia sp. AiPa1 TaxID=573492 RepID=UPI00202AF3F6|nr:SAM-dependent methyltransferase [Frankia sp. AiPa1]MCL9758666.1 SAM-dependent methyltransferase [Frankia sp. AiPa1]
MRGDAGHRRRAQAATVWPTGPLAAGDDASDGRRAGIEVTMTVPSTVAAYAIALHSQPGDIVCDPDCAEPTVVVQAVRARRHALAIAPDTHAWQTVRAALTVAKAQGAPGDGTILDRRPDGGSWAGPGPVDLLLTGIGPDPDPAGPGGPGGDRLAGRLAGYLDLAGPGGRLVVVAAYHVVGGLDLASRIVAAGRQAGWRPVQRAVALTAVLHPRPLDAAPVSGRPRPAHHDVLLFRSGEQPRRPPRPPDPPPSSPAPAAVPPAIVVRRAA